MEGLIQLVAESFARHGIQCPTGEPQTAELTRPAETLSTELPEHNFRKRTEADLVP